MATPPIGEVKFSFWAKVTKASAKTFLEREFVYPSYLGASSLRRERILVLNVLFDYYSLEPLAGISARGPAYTDVRYAGDVNNRLCYRGPD